MKYDGVIDEWVDDEFLKEKLKGMKEKDLERHPLFKYIITPKSKQHLEDLKIIEYNIKTIEINLGKIKDIPKNKDLIRKIFSPENFQGALNELDNICYFLDKKCEVEIDPEVPNGKKMDLKVILDKREIFIECTSPHTKKEHMGGTYDYVNKNAIIIKPQIDDKIAKKQIQPDSLNIFLRDITKTKMGEEDILVTNKLSKEIFCENPEYCAIIVYDRRDIDAYDFKQMRWIILNKDAINKLTQKEINIIGATVLEL